MAMKTVDIATLFTVGPCIDDTDFKTLETAIAYNAAGMDVSFYQEQADGTITKTALTLTSAGSQDWVAVGDGYYSVEITAAQNNTECSAWVAGVATGVLPFESGRFDMVPANVVDSLVKGTDALQVHTNEMTAGVITATVIATDAIDADAIADNAINAGAIASGAITSAKFAAGAIDAAAIATDAIDDDAIATGAIASTAFAAGAITAAAIATDAIDADALAADAVAEIRAVASGTSDSGTTTTMVDAARTEADTDYWKGCWILFTSGTIAGQARLITAFTPGTDTITFAPATTQTVGTQTYQILPAGAVTLADGSITAAVIATDAIDADAIADNAIDAGAIASSAITSAKFAAGAITATVIATDAIDADAMADGAITAATFAASAIDATAIASGAITSAKFAAGAITATVIATDAIDADAMADGAITAATFAAGAIDAAAIATNAIDDDAIATGAIASTAFAAGAITAAAIATDAIDADALATDAVAEIADGVWDEAASGHVTSGTFGQRIAIIRANTAQAGGATTITLDASASASNDFYNNTILHITAGTGVGQARIVEDYDGTTKVATVAAWVTNPDNTSVFVIHPFGAIPGATAPSAAQVADAVWDEATAGHTTSGTFGEQLKTDVDAILDDTGTSGVALAAGSITASVIATDAIDADAMADGAITAATFAAGAITATVIATDAIDDDAIATGAIASTAFAAGAITAAAIATGAVDADALAADAVAEIADGVWDELTSGHTTSGSFGLLTTDHARYIIGDVGVSTGDVLRASFAVVGADGTIVDATACTVNVYEHDGTTAIANGSWTTGPSEVVADNFWYMTKTTASGVLTSGQAYHVKVVFTISGSPVTRWFTFNALS